METVQIQLSHTLVEQIQLEMSPAEALSTEALNQVVADAIGLWLEKQQEKKAAKSKALQLLRQAGMVMDAEWQRASAASMLTPLSGKGEMPSHAQVEAALAKVKTPLSEEIIAMRKDH